MTIVSNSLLLVIPPVIQYIEGALKLDGDFANNLSAYLRHFDRVTVMCPASSSEFTFPDVRDINDIMGFDRLDIVCCLVAFRPGIYFRQRSQVKAILIAEIAKASHILISPHGGMDWSTLAAQICIADGIPYNMEADWNLPAARQIMIREMPRGIKRLRASIVARLHDRIYYQCLRHSSLSLLQGGDVFEELSHIAPNAYSVLNVQITADDRINPQQLRTKVDRLLSGVTPQIVYAGRASDIKGPDRWLDVVTRLRDTGYQFHATWIGDGEMHSEMVRTVNARNLSDVCTLTGKLPRAEARAAIAASHIFMFCHLAKESPRCLVEALGSGTPIVGFGSNYSRELVADEGGGIFCDHDDVEELTRNISKLLADNQLLSNLILKAAASGGQLDRELAIEYRIGLMKAHLRR